MLLDFRNININLKDHIPDLNINIHILNYIFIYFVITIIVGFILFLIISYFVINFFNLDFYYYNILFYDYTNKSKKILDIYGNCKINKIYITRQPLSKLATFILNIITLYKYDTIIKNKDKIILYHYSIILEIELPNGEEKLLLIEKNNSINICENFMIKNSHEIKKINLTKYNYTLIEILNNTKKRIGNANFFNWSINKNNCRVFTKEILKTIKKYNKKNKIFILSDLSMNKLAKAIIPTIFTKHVINSIVNIFNIFEQYIYDNIVY